MGLDIYIKGYPREKAHHASYGLFNRYREDLSAVLGERYQTLYRKHEYTNDEIQEIYDIENKAIDTLGIELVSGLTIFLWHSDCDGKLTPKQCKMCYDAIKDLPCSVFYYTGDKKMHDVWLPMLKYCYQHRVTMWFL